MKKYSDLEYLRLSKFKRIIYNLICFFAAIPSFFVNIGKSIWKSIKKISTTIADIFKEIVLTFKNGSTSTRISYLVMGYGNAARGQVLRGVLFFLFEVIFILYMVLYGGYWLGKFDNLGDRGREQIYNEFYDTYDYVYNDDSFKILLYGILTIFFIIAFVYTWYLNIKQNKIIDEIVASGKKLKSGKDDIRSLVDDQFHKTLLSLPIIGILLFTVLPTIFMILVAFTNYDKNNDGLVNLFTWVGLDNFNELITWSSGSNNFSAVFGEILAWTLMWAILATFTNYFLGMFVAIMINKKGIKFKKLWRGLLVLTIAIPQFISLIYVSKLFDSNGIINGFLLNNNIIKEAIPFWTDKTLARIMVVLINIWVGVPYLMLTTTGVLMNIPADLYESAKIDGANAFQQYVKITLPYMLFVTGPYLLTSFIGNLNNFNVIFLLTGGAPTKINGATSGGSSGETDLLITWLFKITTTDSNYKLASVIGIIIFIIVAVLSLVVYNIMPSNKNEEDYS